MKKRLVLVLTVLAMSATMIAGCTGGNAPSSDDAAPTEEEEEASTEEEEQQEAEDESEAPEGELDAE